MIIFRDLKQSAHARVLQFNTMSRKRVQQTSAAPAATEAAAANGHAKQSSSRDTKHRYPMTSCSCQLVPRCSLPGYLDDNIYLDDYHRPELGSVIECVKTLFSLHTETMNIWTHLAGETLHTCTHHSLLYGKQQT